MAQKGVLRTVEGGRLAFFCPGCKSYHQVTIDGGADGPVWQFNGDFDRPTFSPSILVTSGHYIVGHKGPECWCTYNAAHPDRPAPFVCERCHSFVRDGQIQFLDDCTHELAGKTVPLTGDHSG